MSLGHTLSSVFLGLSLVSSSWAGLLVDAGFESPVAPSGSYFTYGVGTSFGGWTVTGPSPDSSVAVVSNTFICCGYTFTASEGVQQVDLTGTNDKDRSNGVIQTVA